MMILNLCGLILALLCVTKVEFWYWFLLFVSSIEKSNFVENFIEASFYLYMTPQTNSSRLTLSPTGEGL